MQTTEEVGKFASGTVNVTLPNHELAKDIFSKQRS